MTAGPAPAAAPSKRDAVVDALMDLASDRPWNDIELNDLAEAAGVTLSELRDLFPSKGAVLGAFSRRIDKQVLEGTSDDLREEPARERIFDVMMRRLDALTPYRRALRRIIFALRQDPLALAALNRQGLNAMRYMLAAAGISTEGPLGGLKLQGAVIVFSNTLQTWLEDDDPTQARTMARLDRELRRGERVLERAEDLRRLTLPLRAFGQALVDARNRAQRARSRRRPRYDEDDMNDPA
ncbi:MAG TPA: TetR/AcrR family transcriptional regulator, partial [Microvirga sp.]|nr:TetR/AcrR family transcriptional regulator [Microvirga sp.]